MVIYQVYPRSFGRANAAGIGDLRGLRDKLPYLKDLGVEMIWIGPFFKSPMKDFGYDVSDYTDVDPIFGTMSDFDDLMIEAQRLGLGLMLDLVLSHSSNEHPWFQMSRKDRTNPKANWYVWADAAPEGGVPNNWQSLFGGASAWTWDELRGQYYLHNFLTEQPDFNFHEPEVRAALLEACEFWFKKGIRGLRLDVCNFYFHSAGLEDNPIRPPAMEKTEGVHAGNPYNKQVHLFDKDQKENILFLRELRALADRYPQTMLMGEIVSDDSLALMRDYISNRHPLHTAYNFSLFRDSFDAQDFANRLNDFERRVPNGSASWALGNHDVPRFISRFQAAEKFPQSAKTFLFFLFSLRGNVILYQGDELGLSEAEISREQMQDPFGISFYPEFKGRDGCRTPMPWDESLQAIKTWLPVPPEHLKRSVERQSRDAGSVLKYACELIRWRRENPWLDSASLKASAPSSTLLVLSRSIDAKTDFIVVFNTSSEKQTWRHTEIGIVELPPYGTKSWKFSAQDGAIEWGPATN